MNEYLNDCEVLRGGRRQMVPAMTEHERVVIGGIELEASLTSGGLGTMCETYEGRVQRLDYKTHALPGPLRADAVLLRRAGAARPPRAGRRDPGRGQAAGRRRRRLPARRRRGRTPARPAASCTASSTSGPTSRWPSTAGAGARSPGPRRPRPPRSSSWSPTAGCRRPASSSRRTSPSPTCCPPRAAPCSATSERSESDCHDFPRRRDQPHRRDPVPARRRTIPSPPTVT